MGWPQVTWIVLATFGVAVSSVKHGQPKGNWNFWDSIISAGLYSGLLYAGGFFG